MLLLVDMFRGLIERFPRYKTFVGWFVKDLARSNGKRFVGIAAGGFIGSTLQMAAFAMGFTYVSHLEQKKPVELFGNLVHLEGSLGLFMVSVVATGSLLMSGAAIEYWAQRHCNLLAWRYWEYCARRTFSLSSKLNDWPRDEWLSRPSGMAAFTGREAKLLGTAARLVGRGAINVASLPIGIAMLLWLDAQLAFLMLVIGLGALIAYYLLSMRGAMYRRRLERFGKPAMMERQELARRALYAPGAIGEFDPDFIATFEQGASHRLGEAFAEQRIVLAGSKFATQMVTAVALVAAIAMGGAQVLGGYGTWSALAAFLLVLQYTSTKLIGTARVLVSVNRFYPAVRGYSEFLDRVRQQEEITRDRQRTVREKLCMVTSKGLVVELVHDLYGLLLPEPPSRYHLGAVRDALRSSVQPNTELWIICPWFITTYIGPSKGSIRDVYGLPRELEESNLARHLQTYGLTTDRALCIAQQIDQKLANGGPLQLRPVDAFAVSAVAAALSGTEIVVADAAGILDKAEEKPAMLAALAANFRHAFLGSDQVGTFELLDVSEVFLSDGRQIVDHKCKNEIEEHWQAQQIQSSRAGSSADDLEDEDFF